MSNSAFTPTFAQNLQDASATQKGLVNTTTQVFAGKKTFDGGAAIKGDTSGSAVAVGYVGERWASNAVSITPTIGSWVAGTTFGNLPAGDWLLYFRVFQSTNRTTNIAVMLSTNSNNDSTGSLLTGATWGTFAPASQGTANISFQAGLETIAYRVAAGSFPTGQALYPKIYAEGSGTGSIQVVGFAVRIA